MLHLLPETKDNIYIYTAVSSKVSNRPCGVVVVVGVIKRQQQQGNNGLVHSRSK